MSVRAVSLWVVAVVASSTTLAGCGGHSTPAASSSSPSPTASYSGGSTSPTAQPTEQSPSATSSTRPVKDPTAATSIAPVVRHGRTPHPSLSAKPATLNGTVTYSDGVDLQITAIAQSTTKAKGPGEIDGPITTFSLRLRNGSTRSLNLSQVVVTLVYGDDPARIARPSYTGEEQDFAGTVKPGGSAKAVYSFAVPVAQRDQVVVHVDFDAVHAAAVFGGSSLE